MDSLKPFTGSGFAVQGYINIGSDSFIFSYIGPNISKMAKKTTGISRLFSICVSGTPIELKTNYSALKNNNIRSR
jgi:hypothetical protein